MSSKIPFDRSMIEPDEKAKLLLLGTFHFKDAGLDEYKPQHEVDIMSDKRQREIEDVLSSLSAFSPTKVGVERKPHRQEEIDRKYRDYLAGDFCLSSNEIYQLGFRLAARMEHERVYAIDASGRFDPSEVEAFAREHGQEYLLEDTVFESLMTLPRHDDDLKMKHSLKDYLTYTNSEDHIHATHGYYLTGRFKVGKGDEYPGVEFVVDWYRRNLKIFNNVQRITESSDERILVIIGSGHLPILRHAAICSPEYELVEAAEYLS